MKMRLLISALILCCFFIASVNVVSATATPLDTPITDPTDDVFNIITGENVTTKSYIDLRELVVSRDYRKVTLKLTLGGAVKNEGNVILLDPDYLLELEEKLTNGEITYEELEQIYMQTQVSYIIDLGTSLGDYLSYYVNNEVLVFNDEYNTIESYAPIVNNNILTISFNLPSSQENITYVYALTSEGTLLEAEYSDEMVETELYDPLRPDGDDNGGEDNGGNGSPGFELIPLLIAIFIGVLLLKRKKSR